jgi:drug/metabolite transporter (DMT)-like permease
MTIGLCLIGAIIFGLSGALFKQPGYSGQSESRFLTSLYLFGFIALAGAAVGLGTPLLPTRGELGAGAVLAAALSIGNLGLVRAMKIGPVGLTYPVVNAHLVVLVLIGQTVFGERLDALQWAGIVLILISVIGISLNFQRMAKGAAAWLGYVALAFVALGVRNGYLKTVFHTDMNLVTVLAVTYLGSDFLTSLYYLVRERRLSALGMSGYGAVAGVLSAAGFAAYAFALQRGDLSIAAPVFGTYTLFALLAARWMYAERLTPVQYLFAAGGIAGLVLVSVAPQ